MSLSMWILFCIMGVLLCCLIEDFLLSGMSYVIVDEVYECLFDFDFLFVLLRDILSYWLIFKVVLMLVMLNVFVFEDYFKGVFVVSKIFGFIYLVNEYYFEDIL